MGSKLEKVNHPYVSVIVALTSIFAAVGGSGAFWSYLADKERAKLDRQLEAQRHELKMLDMEAQQAATMTIIAEQGGQLKAFKKALEKETSGRHAEARVITGSIEIPIAQGLRVLRGRAVPTEAQLDEKRKAAKKKIGHLEKMVEQFAQ